MDDADGMVWIDDGWRQGRLSPSAAGVFETLGAWAGRLPLWDRHLARLRRGAQALGVPFVPPGDLLHAARELLRDRGRQDDVLRITLTAEGGAGRWTLTTRARGAGTPQRLVVAAARRRLDDPTIDIKSTARAFWHRVGDEARARGADDAVVLDSDGYVCETTVANLWFTVAGGWYTPAVARCLPGVARAALLDELRRRRHAVHESDYRLDDLLASDAIFVTNAVHGPRPVELIGGPPAASTGALGAAWQAVIDPDRPPQADRPLGPITRA